MIHLLLSLLLSPILRLFAGRAPMPPRRVLVIQLAKIGDLICSTAVFRELKRCYPDIELHVMATKINAPLLRVNQHVDHIVEADARSFGGIIGKARLVSKLRKGNYDTVICLNASAAIASAALWAGIPRRMAVFSNYAGRTLKLARMLWTDVEPHRSSRLIQETYIALLERVGITGARVDKESYCLSGAEAKVNDLLQGVTGPLLGIAVSSGNRLKALGIDKITDVCRQLATNVAGSTIVLIGGPDDVNEARQIIAALPDRHIIDTCGALGLDELPALLKRMAVFLGVDSGITYLADTVAAPIVSIAGPVDMIETRPVGNHVIVLKRESLPCYPCSHTFRAPYNCHTGTRACVKEISADQITEAVIGLKEAVES